MSIRENLEIEPFIRCHERPTGFIESIRERPRFVYGEYDLLHRDVQWLVDACEVVLNNCRLLLNDFGWQNRTPDLTYRIEQTIYYELHRLGVADAVGVELVFDGPKLSLNAWPKDTSLNEEIKEEIERRKDRRARGVGTARTVSRNVTMLISGPHCNEVFADWLEDQGLPDQAKACRGAAWSSSFGRDEFGVFAELRVGEAVQLFRWVVPGEFMMGSPDDEEGHRHDELYHKVEVPSGFWMADTSCTQNFWNQVMGSNPSFFRDNPDHPVERVSWNYVQEFLNQLERFAPELDARLPSEAQWEYACRAGTAGPRYGELDDIAWYAGNSNGTTHPVGLLEPNPWGLFDMLGNVWEWSDNCTNLHGTGRIARGGSYNCDATYIRSSRRNGYFNGLRSEYRSEFVGFRLSIPCS